MKALRQAIYSGLSQALNTRPGDATVRPLSHAAAWSSVSREELQNNLAAWSQEAPGEELSARIEAERRIVRCFDTGERRLELSHLPLTSLPEALGSVSHLEHLDVLNAGLKTIPAEIGQLTRLKCLHLAGNDLTELPAQLANLKKLRRLYLNNNQLSALPEWIGELTQLEQLHVPHNRLTELPGALQKLHKLMDLDAHNNRITELPIWLRTLNLRYLDVASNSIRNLSDFVSGQHCLRALIQSKGGAMSSLEPQRRDAETPPPPERLARVFQPAEGRVLGDQVVLHAKK